MGKTSPNAQLSAKEIISIIKNGKSNGLKSLTIGDLSISFYEPKSDSVEEPKIVPVQINDKLQEDVSIEAAEDLEGYVEELNDENLDLEDPGAYEEMVFSKTKIQKQDTPDA